MFPQMVRLCGLPQGFLKPDILDPLQCRGWVPIQRIILTFHPLQGTILFRPVVMATRAVIFHPVVDKVSMAAEIVSRAVISNYPVVDRVNMVAALRLQEMVVVTYQDSVQVDNM